MLWTLVGSRVGRTVGIVLVVGLTLFTMIQWYQREAREELKKDIELEQLNTERETRERIDEAVRPIRNPNVDDSLRYLRERSSD